MASRMESNGLVGFVHASQETANALIAHGKEHWLTPRENKIFAKGKGEVQTYFVNPMYGSKIRSTSAEDVGSPQTDWNSQSS